MHPQIEFYEVFALTDNARGTVERFREPRLRAARSFKVQVESTGIEG